MNKYNELKIDWIRNYMLWINETSCELWFKVCIYMYWENVELWVNMWIILLKMNWQLCDAIHEWSKRCDVLWIEYMNCDNWWFVNWVLNEGELYTCMWLEGMIWENVCFVELWDVVIACEL